jgi:arabinofuranan 3-O-arabinosyltransferase
VRDCYSYDRRAPGKVGIASSVVGPARLPALQLVARDHSACVAIPVAGFRPAHRYRLQLAYRRVSGSPPRLCLWEDGRNRCAALPELGGSRRWHRLDTVVALPSGVSALTLFLYADGTGTGETAAEYRQIRIEDYASVARSVLPGGPVPVGRIALPSGTPSLRVARPAGASTLDLRSGGAVGDCDRYDGRTLAQVGISAIVVGSAHPKVLRLAARDHAACVNLRVGVLNGHTRYRVALDYRRVRGNPPRVCVWEEGPNACAPLPRLQSGAGWHRLDAAVQLQPGTSGLRLFVYADGGGGWETVNDYRRLRVQPEAPLALVGVPPARPLPAVRSDRLTPASVRVHVRDARSPFLLTLTDAYASGWSIESAGHDARAVPHLTVNGYANGWLVPWRGTYDLTLVYRPERYAAAGRRLSAIAACLLLASLVARRAAPRWRRARSA